MRNPICFPCWGVKVLGCQLKFPHSPTCPLPHFPTSPKKPKAQGLQENIFLPPSAKVMSKLSCEIAIIREVCKHNPHTFRDWDYCIVRPRQVAVAAAVPGVDQVPAPLMAALLGLVVCSQITAE